MFAISLFAGNARDQIDYDDKYIYCGTESGDIFVSDLSTMKFIGKSMDKELLQAGVVTIACLWDKTLLVGAGDGTVCVMSDKLRRNTKYVSHKRFSYFRYFLNKTLPIFARHIPRKMRLLFHLLCLSQCH